MFNKLFNSIFITVCSANLAMAGIANLSLTKKGNLSRTSNALTILQQEKEDDAKEATAATSKINQGYFDYGSSSASYKQTQNSVDTESKYSGFNAGGGVDLSLGKLGQVSLGYREESITSTNNMDKQTYKKNINTFTLSYLYHTEKADKIFGITLNTINDTIYDTYYKNNYSGISNLNYLTATFLGNMEIAKGLRLALEVKPGVTAKQKDPSLSIYDLNLQTGTYKNHEMFNYQGNGLETKLALGYSQKDFGVEFSYLNAAKNESIYVRAYNEYALEGEYVLQGAHSISGYYKIQAHDELKDGNVLQEKQDVSILGLSYNYSQFENFVLGVTYYQVNRIEKDSNITNDNATYNESAFALSAMGKF